MHDRLYRLGNEEATSLFASCWLFEIYTEVRRDLNEEIYKCWICFFLILYASKLIKRLTRYRGEIPRVLCMTQFMRITLWKPVLCALFIYETRFFHCDLLLRVESLRRNRNYKTWVVNSA